MEIEASPSTSYHNLSLAQPIVFLLCNILFLWVSTLLKFSATLIAAARGSRSCATRTHDDVETSTTARSSTIDLDVVLGMMGMRSSGRSSDGERAVGFEELASAFEEEEASMEEAMEAFRVFDRNHDGFIDAAELRSVLSALGFAAAGVPVDECRRMIAVYDENKDGKIDFDEFVKLMETSSC